MNQLQSQVSMTQIVELIMSNTSSFDVVLSNDVIICKFDSIQTFVDIVNEYSLL